ncbi:MAG: F0F1 ATP synthase subunit B [Candidatus Komeilibacteria bacterium]|nr:F0F1 ATP synthase subunit B [Candidatus Komeilibacteria bacterium]
MDELIQTFHIDWRLMVAQLVNFVIVFFVLWRFALKPLMKTMADRSKTIEQSLRHAEEIERERARSTREAQEKIREAQHQAIAILTQGKKQAEEQRQAMLAKTKQDVEGVVASAKQQILQEKEQMLVDARDELADLVVTGITKVVGKHLDDKADKKVIARELQQLK